MITSDTARRSLFAALDVKSGTVIGHFGPSSFGTFSTRTEATVDAGRRTGDKGIQRVCSSSPTR